MLTAHADGMGVSLSDAGCSRNLAVFSDQRDKLRLRYFIFLTLQIYNKFTSVQMKYTYFIWIYLSDRHCIKCAPQKGFRLGSFRH